jgi:hypothetical protein
MYAVQSLYYIPEGQPDFFAARCLGLLLGQTQSGVTTIFSFRTANARLPQRDCELVNS